MSVHKIAALVLATVAVAFLFATDVTHASSEPRLVGPTGAARMAAAYADAQEDAADDAATRAGEVRAAAEGVEDGEDGGAEDVPAPARAARAHDAEADETGEPDEAGAAPASTTVPDRVEPFATADGVELHPVSEAVVVTGYHQAGRSAQAVALEPADAAPQAQPPGDGAPAVTEPTTLTLPSRGRGTAPTSAVDLALPAGEPVASPVDGRVRSVEPYRLYGRTGDLIVRIAPAGRPDLDVAVLHVDGVRVKPGQRVAAGETIVADTARVLPFRSQVERFSGEMPHVHLDVRPAEDPATTV